MNIISINIRSVSSVGKFDKFKSLIASFSKLPDVIAIQETWFQKETMQLYNIPGSASVHCCRMDGYGGTSLFINKQLNYCLQVCKSDSFVELISVTFPSVKYDNKPVKLISFYRSQKCSVQNFLEMLENILYEHARNPILLIGDSNIDMFHSPHYPDLLSIFQNFDCQSAHSLVTRPSSKTCIDHVFCNFSENIFVDSVECHLSDHNMLCCRFEGVRNIKDYIAIKKTHCDYEKGKNYLINILPDEYESVDASGLTNTLISSMEAAINHSTTTTEVKKRLRFETTPWINVNLQALILYKEKLLSKRRKSENKGPINEILKRISKIVSFAHKDCRENYYVDNMEKADNNPSKGWNFINGVLGRRKDENVNLKDDQGQIITDDQKKGRYFK